MKKILLTTVFAIMSMATVNAQNLVFDNTFYGGNPHTDHHSGGGFDPNITINSYGRMKQLNDSTFVYFVNYNNSQHQMTESFVYAKIIHSNGLVNSFEVFASSFSYGGTGLGPEAGIITDLATTMYSGKLFVISNELYDSSSTTRRGIRIDAFTENGTSFQTNNDWGDSGTLLVSDYPSNLFNAKGTMVDNYLIVAYSHNTSGALWSGISSSTIITVQGNVWFDIIEVVTPSIYATMGVADIIALSTTEVYIACNSNIFANVGGTFVYNDAAMVLKWNSLTGTMHTDYTANGAGISDIMPWNEDNNTTIVQDHIVRMLYHGGKILVAGKTQINNGVSWVQQGRLTRLRSNGTLDTSFAEDGTFDTDFSTNYYRWFFNDIDLSNDGNYYVSGGGQTWNGSSPSDYKGFILPLSNSGDLVTTLGNNGFLFESDDYSQINEIIITPFGSSLGDNFVFNGAFVLNPFPQLITETAMGRLVWSSGAGSCAITNIVINDISCTSTDAYSVTLTVYYQNAPASGTLNVATIPFSATGSPQSITINNLSTNGIVGNPIPLNVFFVEETTCQYNIGNAWTVPDCSNIGVKTIENSILGLYPNPANTVVNIELKEATQIRIINVLGETLLTQQFNKGNNTLDVSGLSTGVYFLQTENGTTIKFIKE